MKIVHISDTHNMLNKVTLPDADLLVHSGDWTSMGSVPEIIRLNEQLGKIKTKYPKGIILVPGNHDWLAQQNPELCRELLSNATILIDEAIEIDGLKIYGSPWQPEFNSWAFNKPRGELKPYYDAIPLDTDILITHGPPRGLLDRLRRISAFGESCQNLGCDELLEAVERIKPKYHLFGHIHDGYGIIEKDGTVFMNSSVCDEAYRTTNSPQVFEL